MSTDLVADHTTVERIAIVFTIGVTSTSSGGESRQLKIKNSVRSPSFEPAAAATYLPDSSTYVTRELKWPAKGHSNLTVTAGQSHWDVIEPASSQGKGIEAASHLFAKRVARTAAVLAVAYSAEGDVYLVWTFISRRAKQIRRRIYEEELRLMHEFPELTFDFNVVSLDSAEVSGLLPDDLYGRIVFYREPRA